MAVARTFLYGADGDSKQTIKQIFCHVISQIVSKNAKLVPVKARFKYYNSDLKYSSGKFKNNKNKNSTY